MVHSDKILSYINAYKISNAFFLATEVGLFKVLRKPITVELIAEQLNAEVGILRILLDLFVGLKIVKKDEESYYLQKEYLKLLGEESASSMHNLVNLEAYLSKTHSQFENMKAALYGRGEDRFNKNNKEGCEQIYGMAMDNGGRYASLCIARAFINQRQGRILDIGGGCGTYAIQICKLNKNLSVDIGEKIEMRKICEENIAANDLEDRIKFIPMDIVNEDIKKTYEGVLISNVLHLFNEEINKLIIKKAFQALKKSGLLVLHDFFLNEEKTGPYIPLLYTLDWMVLGSAFNASFKDIKKWLTAVEQVDINYQKYDSIPTSIISAKKL